MADFPIYRMPPPPVLHTLSPDCRAFGSVNVTFSGLTSNAWETTNLAWFYPFTLTDAATAYKLLFYVGATSSGNIDVGIYDSQKNLIVSAGSTAMSVTVNTVQEIDIADTQLPAGDYYLAAACDNTTGTVFSTVAATDEQLLANMPIYSQAGLTAAALTNPGVPVLASSATPDVVSVGILLASVF